MHYKDAQTFQTDVNIWQPSSSSTDHDHATVWGPASATGVHGNAHPEDDTYVGLDECTDTDTLSSSGDDQEALPFAHLPEHEQEQELLRAYDRAKRNFRRFLRKVRWCQRWHIASTSTTHCSHLQTAQRFSGPLRKRYVSN